MSRAESPHDQWAEVGFYEPEVARQRQHKRQRICDSELQWDCVKKPKDFPRGPYTTEELEGMELIGE